VSIKFVCSCGKHLKARDDMAQRRVVCPRCGYLAGVPALTPTNPEGAAPLTPAERVRRNGDRGSPPLAALPPPAPLPPRPTLRPVDTRVVRLLSRHQERRPALTARHLEKRWHECLLYPLRARYFCVGIALMLTVVSAGMTAYLPGLLAEPPADPWALAGFSLCWALLLVLAVGLPCSFLDCVLASAAQGEIFYLCWSGNLLVSITLSGMRWLTCFLAGPVVFAGVGFLYWLHCGDPSLLDCLIVAELGIVAVAYQIFAMLAVTDRGRLRDLNPLAVADLVHRLGWRALLLVLAGGGLLLAHGLLLVEGITDLHDAAPVGLAILACVWTSTLFWSTFLMRLLGIWCHRTRRPPAA
jgi:hypothetical protein